MKQNNEYTKLRNRLEKCNKRALAIVLMQQSAPRRSGEELLVYVSAIEKMLPETEDPGGMKNNSTGQARQESIFNAIRIERRRQDADWGAAVKTQDMTEWASRLIYAAHEASVQAHHGDNVEAMRKVLIIARDSVACLEQQIPQEAHRDLLDGLEEALSGNGEKLKKQVNALRDEGWLPEVPSKRFKLDELALDRQNKKTGEAATSPALNDQSL